MQDLHFEPHHHAWAQLAYCASGLIQVSTQSAQGEHTYIVPPSRAVWIAPGVLHSITAMEAAELRTLYIHASAVPAGWSGNRVIVVSTLLRELIPALDACADAGPRQHALSLLALDEIAQASTQALGIPMPQDKRLRQLCESLLREPAQRATLADWAQHMGASERTLARLFRTELGSTYGQWRQQVLLAHALPMLARGTPVGQVAAASGYESVSAFSAMFKTAMGSNPSQFAGPSK
jgi:AraC-like DNA-binding protein